ncbi:MAG: hypothetical protein HFI74_07505 [Lachnospiraceae bacterium]|jgi:hypothetical protein|nr:hypothetical protein [Lachnospiraceae bacterium]
MKHKKLLALFLGAILGCCAIACSAPGEQPPSDNIGKEDGQKPQGQKEDGDSQGSDSEKTENQKPVLDENATDEDLLDLVKDDTKVVAEKEYAKTISDMKEHVEDFSGQLYQMEGYYLEEDGTSYITDDPKSTEGNSLPLRYVQEAPKSGAKIRITGIAEQGEDDTPVFSVVVLESLD